MAVPRILLILWCIRQTPPLKTSGKCQIILPRQSRLEWMPIFCLLVFGTILTLCKGGSTPLQLLFLLKQRRIPKIFKMAWIACKLKAYIHLIFMFVVLQETLITNFSLSMPGGCLLLFLLLSCYSWHFLDFVSYLTFLDLYVSNKYDNLYYSNTIDINILAVFSVLGLQCLVYL